MGKQDTGRYIGKHRAQEGEQSTAVKNGHVAKNYHLAKHTNPILPLTATIYRDRDPRD